MLTAKEAKAMTEQNKIDSINIELIRVEKKIKEAIGKKANHAWLDFNYDVHPMLLERVKELGFFKKYWEGSGTYYLELEW